MKHLFLINPAAGKFDHTFDFSEKIHQVCKAQNLSYRILVSKKPGDITEYARKAGESREETRIYACGGDGTLNEAVCGAAGFSNLSLTHFPGGSGNDFIKVFSDPSRFFRLEDLLDAEETAFDLIRCGDRYALNICSMGLDARIGTEIGSYKRLPGLSGQGAYVVSTAVNFCKGIHEHYVVEIDGEVFDGRQTLICVCSGRFYGGGFNPVPDAEPDDGILEVLLVRDVSRITVAKVIRLYKNGGYRKLPELIRHFRAKNVTIHCDKVSPVNLDGELLRQKDVTFSVVPGGIRFFYPRGLTYAAHPEQRRA